MTEPLFCVLLHSDPLAQLHLCVFLHAHTPYRVVGIPRSHAELEAVFTKTRVDLVICGGAFRTADAKALRVELRRRGLPILLLRHHDRPASVAWLGRRIARCETRRPTPRNRGTFSR